MLTVYYEAAKKAAALAEKDWFGIVKLTGNERATWLQGMVTNDVVKLAPGTGCYAAHLTPQGKVVAQMHVLADDDALFLSCERAAVPHVISAFDKLLIMEDVQMSDVSEQFSILSLIGPQSRSVIESWLDEPLNVHSLYDHRRFEPARVVMSELGYDLWVPREQADKPLRALAASGATAIDHGTWDVLRTEAGIPVYGVDIDETTTLPELGENGISYDKGCYIGQEVVAKVKYIGHVNRRFVGLILEGASLPQPRSSIQKSGKDAGYVTTTLFSPGLNKPIALGFVNRGASAEDTEVEIKHEGAAIPAKVVALPFKVNS